MKYVILDTNIYIDILFDRNRNVKKSLVESFIKLLDNNQVTLVVPEIIKFETLKHIDDEFAEVGKSIKNAKEAIDKIRSINADSDHPFDAEEKKKAARAPLNQLFDIFEQHEADYKSGIENLINKLLEHSENKHIDSSSDLINSCLKRQVFKQAPFLKESKNCLADGLITATLVDIGSYIDLKDDDEVVFVTGNTEDFSEKGNKSSLHPDIVRDIAAKNLGDKVKYETTFKQLINLRLKDEVENARLYEEFQKELEEMQQDYELSVEEEVRASVGLTSLSEINNNFDEKFSESEFCKKFIEIMHSIYEKQKELAQIGFRYYDIYEKLNNMSLTEVNEVIAKLNDSLETIGIEKVESSLNSVNKLLSLLEEKGELASFDDFSEIDYLKYGEDVSFVDTDLNEITLSMSPFSGELGSDSTERLALSLENSQHKELASGEIEIYTGYITTNDDGNIGDGCVDECTYYADDIINYAQDVLNSYEDLCEKEKTVSTELSKIFELE